MIKGNKAFSSFYSKSYLGNREREKEKERKRDWFCVRDKEVICKIHGDCFIENDSVLFVCTDLS